MRLEQGQTCRYEFHYEVLAPGVRYMDLPDENRETNNAADLQSSIDTEVVRRVRVGIVDIMVGPKLEPDRFHDIVSMLCLGWGLQYLLGKVEKKAQDIWRRSITATSMAPTLPK